MNIRKGVAATLMLGTLLIATTGCAGDSCACSYPDDDKSSGTSDGSKSKPA